MKLLRLRNVIFSFSLLGLSLHAATASAFSVIVDYDDTLKISHVRQLLDSARRSFTSNRLYFGSTEYFQELESAQVSWGILSAGPTFMAGTLRRTLREHQLSPSFLVMRNLATHEKTLAHKIARLRELFQEQPAEKWVLIGDDTESDAAAYAATRDAFPGRVLAIYIHRVTGEALDLPAPRAGEPSVEHFWTWRELAWKETSRGRLPPEAMARLEGLWADSELPFQDVFPKFAVCPTEAAQFDPAPKGFETKWDRARDDWIRECLEQ